MRPAARATTTIDGVVYDVLKLRDHAERWPIREIPLASLRALVAPEQFYWLDRDDRWLSPAMILADWPAARDNPAWREHTERIARADLSWPIWLLGVRLVDGAHRLTRAFLDDVPSVRARIFLELPAEAIVGAS